MRSQTGVIASSFFIVMVLASMFTTCHMQKGNRVPLCGRRLAITLVRLCEDNRIERDPPEINAQEDAISEVDIKHILYRGLGKSEIGIHQECCEKVCTVEDMLRYCDTVY